MTWQPISTLPKDVACIVWEPQTDYQKQHGYAENGNYEIIWANDRYDKNIEPTHWFPLPLPPTEVL